MIEFYITPETEPVLLNDYNGLFDCICDFESSNGFGSEVGAWSFAVHSPARVVALYTFATTIAPDLQEAYDEQVSLLEISTGTHANPQYIAITPNIDMDALKKKWCLDYCAFHELAIMDSEVKDGKLFESCLQFEGRSWSFVIYPPDRVVTLYEFAITIDPELQEAYDEQLSLLEICDGDYKSPQYIALTPRVDVCGLKKKWCLDYCRVHGLAICETGGEETDASLIAEEDAGCWH